MPIVPPWAKCFSLALTMRSITLCLAVGVVGSLQSVAQVDQDQKVKSATLPFVIEDWFGEPKARVSIARGQGKSTTLVLADDLDLTDRIYSVEQGTAPQNVIIVTDTLRLTDLAQFDLGGTPSVNPDERSGGQLVVFARRIICQHGARVLFRGAPTYLTAPFKPGAPAAFQVQSAPHYGQFFIAAESVQISPELQEDILERVLLHDDLLPRTVGEPLGEQTAKKITSLIQQTYEDEGQRRDLSGFVEKKKVFDNDLVNLVFKIRADAFQRGIAKGQTDLFQKYIAGDDSPAIGIPLGAPQPSSPPVFRSATDAALLIQYAPDFKLALSEWAVRWLQNMSRRVSEASLRDDRAEIYQDLTAVDHFPQYPIDAKMEKRYLDQLTSLHNLKVQNVMGLHVQPVDTTPVTGAEIHVDTYSEGQSLNFKLGPTTALLREVSINGTRKLGLCRFDPKNPHELEFYISADLGVDPSLAAAVADAGAKKGGQYTGLFTRWNLSTFAFDTIPGVISDKSTITVAGSLLQAKLVFPDTGIGLVQWSMAGIPLSLHWQYVDDPKINGTFNGLLLKRTGRVNPQISVNNGVVTNNNALPVRIRYAIAGDRKIIEFAPNFIEIDPGKSASLTLPADVDKATVKVPAEAVECIYHDVRNYAQDFQIINGDQLAEEIEVRNELSSHGIAGKDAIDWIDVTLEYQSGVQGAVESWSTKLLANPSDGAVRKHWFYRARDVERQITVSGKVHYVDGSSDDLKSSKDAADIIHIGLERIK